MSLHYLVIYCYHYTCFRLSLLSDINVSQGSVATLVRCGGIFNANVIANFLTSQAVKEVWKSANIWRSYRKNKKVRVFLRHSVHVLYKYYSPIFSFVWVLVPHFPFLHFPPLRSSAAFSFPAFSISRILSVPDFVPLCPLDSKLHGPALLRTHAVAFALQNFRKNKIPFLTVYTVGCKTLLYTVFQLKPLRF